MTNLKSALNSLRRPKILVRAARMGAQSYRRDRDLAQILKSRTPVTRALPALLAAEEVLEETRVSGDVTYSIQSHIGVLIALIAESRLSAA